ncbi:ABC transporter family substrate-binding protein [Glycomyces arizonensis]|uniref:ABC transporter family substrate-binding protein n=1 Tax=Glycomyces arizonensis TaxID=256035 RepID=UPI0004249858|nr:ABC transporter family substrate-binding protein [Glycomyces arizonensis]
MALTRRALGGLTVGGSAAVALSACGGNEDEGGSDSGSKEVVWAVSSSWSSWNLNTTGGNTSYGNQALTPMNPVGQVGYDFGPDGKVFYDDAIFAGAPELAAEEPMTIKYTLNENAQWSDGKPIRVEDFIFQWYSMSGNPEHANQEKALPASTDWGSNVASIEQAEDGTILVTYVDGYIDPEWSFSGGVYLPSHLAEENGFENWQSDPDVMGDAIEWFDKTAPTVGSGPYVPTEAKAGEYVVYEPNENYQGSVKPKLSKLTMKVVEGTASIVTELRQGSIAGSWPSEFSEEENAKAAEDQALSVETYEGSVWLHVDANCNDKFLSDVELRKAVYTAINVPDIITKNYPETDVNPKGNHFFSEGGPYYVDFVTPTGQGSGDADAARQILTDAGYTWNGDDKLVSPDGEVVVFDCRYGESAPVRKTAAELMQSYLAPIGIDLELQAIPDGELSPVLTGGDFGLIIFGWSGNPAFTVAPAQFFRSDSGSNYGKYNNPDVDAAVDKVRSTFDLDEAAEYANAADQIVVPDAYVLPLFDEPQVIMYNGTLVTGVQVNGNSQSGPIYNVREWDVA